ncbi:MAG: hypothetical protein WBA82_00080, partial [Castellaniella sp.]|uniref:hypothetical protein n=1 Tax=Castellaniella sp. TaxID=1955812 RepID=UPI003C72282D
EKSRVTGFFHAPWRDADPGRQNFDGQGCQPAFAGQVIGIVEDAIAWRREAAPPRDRRDERLRP